MTSIAKLLLTKYQIKINNDNGLFMITSISSQNTIFIMSTIIVIIAIFVFVVIEKEHKRLLSFIFFDFESLKDLITFNHISHQDKFKRFKH